MAAGNAAQELLHDILGPLRPILAREALTPDESRYLQQTTNNTLSGVLGEMARIKPTLHKSQGDPVSILVARDVDLSPVYALRSSHGRR